MGTVKNQLSRTDIMCDVCGEQASPGEILVVEHGQLVCPKCQDEKQSENNVLAQLKFVEVKDAIHCSFCGAQLTIAELKQRYEGRPVCSKCAKKLDQESYFRPCHFQARQEEKDGIMGTERGQVLLEAHKIINGDRQQSYGNPEDTHAVIADMWNGYMRAKATATGECASGKIFPRFVKLSPKDVALMMVLFKIGRELNGAGCKDNLIDAAGYIALAAGMNEQSNG